MSESRKRRQPAFRRREPETRELAAVAHGFAQHACRHLFGSRLGSASPVRPCSITSDPSANSTPCMSRISDSLSGAASNIQAREGADMMREFAERMMTWSDQNPEYVQIVVREMMEIPGRLSEAHQWLLADFIQEALELSERATASRSASKVDAEMILMLIIGAVTNFHVSLPTFMRLRGASDPLDMKQRFINTLDQLIRTTLAPQHGRRSDDPVR